MRRPAGSLRWRLTAWYVSLLAVVLSAFSLMVYALLDRQLAEAEDDSLQSLSLLVDRAIVVDGGRLALRDAAQASGRDDRFVRIYDLRGRRVLDSSGTLSGGPVTAGGPPAVGASRFETFADAGRAFRMLSTPIRRDGALAGELQVAQLLDEKAQTEGRLLLILAAAIPATLLLSSWGGAFLASRALEPIDRLTRAAQRITAEDLSQRLRLPERDDELGRLAATFDMMIARLEQAFQRQRQFTADASHELRTPLTAMRGQLEVALGRTRDEAEYRETLSSVLEQTEHMSRLVADMLTLARTDAASLPLRRETLDLAQMARDVAAQIQPLAASRAISLGLDAPAALPVLADEDRLLQVLLNLLDNALRHAGDGGAVDLACRAEGEQAVIVVRDAGPGIAAEHLPHIFDRFYRADTPRSRKGGGAGLGLAIVRTLVEAHGGSIEARSPAGGGTAFVVRLPRA